MVHRAWLGILVLVTAVACSDGVSTETESNQQRIAVVREWSSSLEWEDCAGGLECANFQVPFDYENPSLGTFTLPVARRLANIEEQRIGTLLINPGGPGVAALDFVGYADQIFSASIIDRFDIVAWDPRGTGQSIPAIDCTDDYDYFFAGGDITPDTDQERAEGIATYKEFTDLCFEKNGDLLPYVGTNNSARDMDMIRRALGEDKISYFGFSYGSELGATWATLFPDTVRAAVLDGASDPEADWIDGGLQQNKGFEDAIATFLAQCSANSTCAFHNSGDAEGAFDSLMESLDENPIPTTSGRPDLTRGMALTAVAQAMYDDAYWSELEIALVAAQADDGIGLLSLFDEYFQMLPDGSYGNELEAFLNILCADNPQRMTIEEADSYVPQFQANAPRLAPGTTGDYTCVFWPPALDPRITITGIGAGPIVVIGTTGDPATPLEGTRNMANVLEDGRLIVVTAEQHTGYNFNSCVNDAVDTYLIDLVVPAAELDC